MKALFFILFALVAVPSFGQFIKKNDKSNPIRVDKRNRPQDIALQVIYVDKNKLEKRPVYFINGTLILQQTILGAINPEQIESFNLGEGDTLINNITYHGQIFIKTKKGYKPKFISLTDLKVKYTDFKDKSVLFMLDGNLISGDYDKYLVDENNLLTIMVDQLEIKENIELGVIKLRTKSEENIKERRNIRIRGSELVMNE